MRSSAQMMIEGAEMSDTPELLEVTEPCSFCSEGDGGSGGSVWRRGGEVEFSVGDLCVERCKGLLGLGERDVGGFVVKYYIHE